VNIHGGYYCSHDESHYERPAELFQKLIRYDTNNPPGNERAWIQYINVLLLEAGFKTSILARAPGVPT
jgi:acetylornithine deacetylase/succinyl-diaminopimelate desuccinylase-like protein